MEGDSAQTVGPSSHVEPARPVEGRVPRPGDVVELTASASVQFAGAQGLCFRVSRVDLRPTYVGWVWLVGYTLDHRGRASERREVFVQVAGLRWR